MYILGTNFKRYRHLWPSGIPALGDLLIFIRGSRMMWSWYDMKPGWLNQDDAHWTITCFIGMDYANLHIEKFSTTPFISMLCSPLPPYKNLCLHRDVEMGSEVWVPHLPGGQHTFFYISCCLFSIVAAGSQNCVCLHHQCYLVYNFRTRNVKKQPEK